MRIRKMLVIAVVTIMALFAVPLPAQAADDGNRDNCRGYVWQIAKSGSKVVTRYMIKCDRVQNSIKVSADATRHTSGLPTVRATNTCTNTSTCSVSPKVANPSGKQLFSGAVWSASATRSGHKVGCGFVAEHPGVIDGMMNCTSRDKFL